MFAPLVRPALRRNDALLFLLLTGNLRMDTPLGERHRMNAIPGYCRFQTDPYREDPIVSIVELSS